MSLFADKWTSPFGSHPLAQGSFRSRALGDFRLGPYSSFFDNSDTDTFSSTMRTRSGNGPTLFEPGFYDHFDAVFHGVDPYSKQSRRHELTDSSRRSTRTNGGRQNEYIIPIRIETPSSSHERVSQPSNKARNQDRSDPVTSPDSRNIGREIQIPIVRESSEQDKPRARPVPTNGSRPTDSPPVFTPTTEEGRGSKNRDKSCDEVLDSDAFFAKSRLAQWGRKSHLKHDLSDIVVEVDDSADASSARGTLQRNEKTTVLSRNATSNVPRGSGQSSSEPGLGEKLDSHQPSCSCAGRTDITPTPSYPIYDYLKPRLACEDRQIDYIRGDGNCFFRALSKDLYGTEQFHTECRQAVCDLIQAHPDIFRQYMDQGNVSQHLDDMRSPGSWATSCEIYAAATLLQRTIYMFAPSPACEEDYRWLLFLPQSIAGDGEVCDAENSRNKENAQPCYLTLCHSNGNHYDRITPIMAPCNCHLPSPCLTGLNMSVDLTMEDEEITVIE